MSTGTRVFVARVAGLPVFDPNGDQVGRVRDVVVALRIGRDAPRVLGLAVEIQARRRIFVPIGRVTSVDPEAVLLSTGTVSLRRFDKRPGETLVLAELLDRRVTLRETGEQVTVLDIAMEETRTDWLLTRLAVRRGVSGLRSRRRGELLQVEWDEVDGFGLAEDGQGAANLLAVFEKLRPADLAGVMHDLSDKRRAEIAAALDDERLADVLEEMPEDEQ
ncbi:MAG: MgtE intracellular region, partial [Frankiales bacterium]|nr:MgtE intracellular region [Frankiales bacterium]